MKNIFLILIFSISISLQAEEFVSVCDRTPGVRDRLVSRIAKNCESITTQDLEMVAHLYLASVNTTKLVPSDFQGLSRLNFLSITGNPITEIEPDTFSHLKGLLHLNLKGNKIRSLSPLSFRGLSRVSILTLSDNPLSDFDPHLFQEMPLLEHLSYARTLLQRIPKGICSTLPAVKSIDLRFNPKFTEISDFAFSDCSPDFGIFVEGSPLTQTRKAAFQGVGVVDGLPANFDLDSPSDEWGSL